MYQYSIIQWLFFFYFYCFGGWCFESTYVSIKDKKLTNRGFMRGPFLPIYGSGATMMLVVSMPFQDNLILTYLAGCVGATVLEYVTGVVMEALFKVRYWDYSAKKFNFQGHICLSSTLAWGFFTILMTEIIHVPIEKMVLMIPSQVLTVFTLFLTAGIFADFALSFKAAIDLRNVLVKMEQVKEEMLRIQKRLDVIIAFTNEGITESMSNAKDGIVGTMSNAKNGIVGTMSNVKDSVVGTMSNAKDGFVGGVTTAKDGLTQNMSELMSSIEGKLAGLKNMIQTKPNDYLESKRDELIEIKADYTVKREDHKRLSAIRDFFQRSMLRDNPNMTSMQYKESLEELKAILKENS